METLVWKEITDWDQNVEDEALARKALKSLVIHLSRPSKALGERSRSNCYANFVDSSSTMRRNVGRKQTNPSAAAAFTAKLLAKPPNRRQRNLHKNPSRKLGDDQTITSSTSPYLHRRPLHQSTQHSQQTPPQPHIINSNQSNIINRERVLVLIEKLALAESEKEQYQIQVKEMVATREILERELESTRIEFEKLQQQHDDISNQFSETRELLQSFMDKSEHQQQQQPQPQQESTLESHSMGNKNIASGKISASISNQEATTPAQSLPITSTIINPQPLAPQQQPAIDTSSREMASHLKSLENEVQRLALLLQSNLAKQTSIIEQQQHQASHLQKVLLKDVLSHKDQNENNNPIPVDATTLSDFSSHIVSTAKEMLAAGSLDIPHLTQPEPSPQGLETETSESSQSSISSISAYPSAILTPKNMRQMLELIMKKNMRHILKSATVQATASSESANGIGQKVEAVVDESSSATTEPTTASIKESVPSSAAGRFGQADKILKTAKKYELSFADFSGPSMDLPYSSGGDSNPIPLDEQPQPHSLYDHQHEHHDHLQHNRKRQPDGNHLHISKHQHDKTGPECNPPIRGADSSSLLAPTSQKYFSNHFNLRGGVKAAATAQPAASMPSNTKPSSHSASYFMRGTGREEQQQKWQVAADAAAARNLKAAAAAATTKDSYSSGLFVTTSSSRVKSRESRSAAPPHHQNNLTRSRSPASSRISIQSDDSYLFVNDTSMLNSLIRVVSEMEAKETKPQGKKALPDIINKEDEDEDADELESVISSLNE